MKKLVLSLVAVLAISASVFAAEKASLGAFMAVYSTKVGGADLPGLMKLTDRKMLHKRMTPDEMSGYIGSSTSQSKMVYRLSDSKDKLMTPLEFVHFLSDDLFNRKALQMFVKETEKVQLRHRMRFMDAVDSGKPMSAAEISALLNGFLLDDTSVAIIKSILDGIQ